MKKKEKWWIEDINIRDKKMTDKGEVKIDRTLQD